MSDQPTQQNYVAQPAHPDALQRPADYARVQLEERETSAEPTDALQRPADYARVQLEERETSAEHPEALKPYGSIDSGFFFSGGRLGGCAVSLIVLIFPVVVLGYGIWAWSRGALDYELSFLPLEAFRVITAISIFVFAPLMPFRLWLLFSAIREDEDRPHEDRAMKRQHIELWKQFVDKSQLDNYLVMVAVYQEAGIMPRLVRNLARLKYPDNKVKLLLLVEAQEDDDIAHKNADLRNGKKKSKSIPIISVKRAVWVFQAVWRSINYVVVPILTFKWLSQRTTHGLFGDPERHKAIRENDGGPQFQATTYQAAIAAVLDLDPEERQRFIVAKVPKREFSERLGKMEPQTKPRALNFGIYHPFAEENVVQWVAAKPFSESLYKDFAKSYDLLQRLHELDRAYYASRGDKPSRKWPRGGAKDPEAYKQAITGYLEHIQGIDENRAEYEALIKRVWGVSPYDYIANLNTPTLTADDDIPEKVPASFRQLYESKTAVRFWRALKEDADHNETDQVAHWLPVNHPFTAVDADEMSFQYCAVYDAEDRPEEDQLLKAVRDFYRTSFSQKLYEMLSESSEAIVLQLYKNDDHLAAANRLYTALYHAMKAWLAKESPAAALKNVDPISMKEAYQKPDGAPKTHLKKSGDEQIKLVKIEQFLDECFDEVMQFVWKSANEMNSDFSEQLRKELQADHPKVVCLQGKLTYENLNDNWIISLFKADYASWFNYMLPGLHKARLPIPLGGTSNHFRLSELRALGGWDAFNVTEDCDLGMWIARAKYEVRVLNSITWEVANGDFYDWIRQRSRWVKGFAQTYYVHMRNPRRLWQDLQWRGFWSFQFTVGSAFILPMLGTLFYTMTFFYIFSLVLLVIDSFIPGVTVFNALRPALSYIFDIHYHWILPVGTGSFFISNAIYALILIVGQLRHPKPGAMRWVITWWWLYWILMVFAGLRALWEYIVRPYHWELSDHNYV
jgi:cellulose synthase/poly-beta-1,6-N-acetylglucosamine synthase-like glycosyltransferase